MTPNAPPNKHLDYLLTAYLFENLSAAGKKEVETHLTQCPACRAELDALRATMGLLATALNDGGKTYVFEEQRKKRVLDAARQGQLGFATRKLGIWQWRLNAVAAIVMVGVVCLLMKVVLSDRTGKTMDRLSSGRAYGVATTSPASTTASIGAAPEFEGRLKSALMSDRDVDPTSTEDIKVPSAVLKKAELSDHFETINLDTPDSRSGLAAPDSHMFHSVKGSEAAAGGGGKNGAALEDMIGETATKTPEAKSPGTGGGPGESFGNRIGGGRRLDVKRHGGLKEPEAEGKDIANGNGADPGAGRGSFGYRLEGVQHEKEESKKEAQGIANNNELPAKPSPENKPASLAAPANKDVGIVAKDELLPLQDGESKSPGQGQSVEELNKQLAQQNAQITYQLARKLDEKTAKLDDEKALPEKAQDERTATITGKNSKAPALGYKLPPPGETSAVDQEYLFDDVAKREPKKKPALNTLPEPAVQLGYIIPPAVETPPPPPSSIPRPPVVAFGLDSNAPQQPAKPAIVATTPVAGITALNTTASATIQGGQPNDPAAPSESKFGRYSYDGKGSATVDPLGQTAQFGVNIEMWAKTKSHANDNDEHEFFYGASNGKDDAARLNKMNKQGFVAKSLQSLGDIEKKDGIEFPANEELDVSIHGGLADVTKAKKSGDDGKINALRLNINAGDQLASELDKVTKQIDANSAATNQVGSIVNKSINFFPNEPANSPVFDTALEIDQEQSKASIQLDNLARRGVDLSNAVGNTPEERIESLIRKGVSVYQVVGDVPDQPSINGKVLANRDDAGLVMLSVGSNNNVKLGYQFTISKGADVKGIAQVVNVYPDMCSAKIVPGTANTNGLKIEANDEVRSNLDERAKLSASPISLDTAELSLRGYRALREENPKLTLAQFFRRPDVVHPVPLTDEGLDEDDYVTKYGTRPFVDCARDHLSTFGLDVDTAAYTLARAALRSEKLPDPGSVKVEEFLNYFKQAYQVQGDEAFGVFAESAQSPFIDSPVQARDATPLSSALNANNLHSRELLKIGIKSRAARPGERKPAMLTFVVDTSGSMSKPAGVNHDMSRLALVKQALAALVESLQPEDAVSIVGFRDQSELVLPRTQASQKQRILDAIDSMSARGSTNVETGLNLGYRMADEAYATNAVNRMILFSDGVANVGEKGPDEILKLVKIFASRGIDLSTIGIGMGKINDPMMRTLADNGNGSCHFADTLAEAQTILTQKLPPHLNVLARDAKVQVDFDSDTVKSYRLLGYEKRKIADKDFRNDKIDSGDVTHDTLVTVFYEIVRQSGVHGALGKVYLRWKDAGSPRLEVVERNYPLEQGIYAGPAAKASPDFRFLACVARFAELLRDSKWTRQGSYAEVLAELDRLPNEFKAKPECQEVRDLVARAQRLSVTKWKCEILK